MALVKSIDVNVTTGERAEILCTPEEEAVLVAAETKAAIDKIAADIAVANAAIKAEMDAADLKIIRALIDGDTEKIKAHKIAQAERRAKLA